MTLLLPDILLAYLTHSLAASAGFLLAAMFASAER